MKPRFIVPLLLCAVLSANVLGQNLKVRVESERLRISGPQLRFLKERPLERLQNGSTVVYALQLTIREGRSGRTLHRVTQRFSFSYDLWEEKFTVTRLDTPQRSASNLSTQKAEAWCMDNLSIPVSELPKDRPFWVALEFESEEARDPSRESSGLSWVIDVFSRRPRDEQQVRGGDQVEVISLAALLKGK